MHLFICLLTTSVQVEINFCKSFCVGPLEAIQQIFVIVYRMSRELMGKVFLWIWQ